MWKSLNIVKITLSPFFNTKLATHFLISFKLLKNLIFPLTTIVKTYQELLIVSHLSESIDVPAGWISYCPSTLQIGFSHQKSLIQPCDYFPSGCQTRKTVSYYLLKSYIFLCWYFICFTNNELYGFKMKTSRWNLSENISTFISKSYKTNKTHTETHFLWCPMAQLLSRQFFHIMTS